MPASDLNGDNKDYRVQSGHTSLAPHTELFMRTKSGEESEYISGWGSLGVSILPGRVIVRH